MENITIEVSLKQMKEAIESNMKELLTSSYNNPIKKALENVIADKQGEIQKLVSDVISESIQSPEFRAKLGDIVMNKMVEATLKK